MPARRKVEVFVAGCPVCDDAVVTVRRLTCDSCEVEVLNLQEDDAAARAAVLGVRSVPAVAIDGELAACCSRGGIDEEVLLRAGLGRALS